MVREEDDGKAEYEEIKFCDTYGRAHLLPSPVLWQIREVQRLEQIDEHNIESREASNTA